MYAVWVELKIIGYYCISFADTKIFFLMNSVTRKKRWIETNTQNINKYAIGHWVIRIELTTKEPVKRENVVFTTIDQQQNRKFARTLDKTSHKRQIKTNATKPIIYWRFRNWCFVYLFSVHFASCYYVIICCKLPQIQFINFTLELFVFSPLFARVIHMQIAVNRLFFVLQVCTNIMRHAVF